MGGVKAFTVHTGDCCVSPTEDRVLHLHPFILKILFTQKAPGALFRARHQNDVIKLALGSDTTAS